MERAENKSQDFALLGLFVLLALLLSWPILNMGVWQDELCSLYDVNLPDLPTVIAKMYGRMDDLHPPLSYVPLYFAVKYFGQGEFVLRSSALACGILLIPALYWLGHTVKGRAVGLLAAFFAAVSPFASYFGCQARGYALATLLTAICLVYFCKLVENENADEAGRRLSYKWPFFMVTMTTAALCYTEYVSCFILPALGLATVWITLALRQSADPLKRSQAWPTFKRCFLALFIGFLLFVPWIPSALTQSANMRDLVTPVSRFDWPKIFGYNLLMMSPVPLIIGQPLGQFIAVLIAALAIKNRRLLSAAVLREKILAVEPSYAVMLSALLLPSSLIGYITPWCYGYFRYIYPYSPAGWILLATVLLHLFTAPVLNGQERTQFVMRRLAVTLFMAMGVIVNICSPDMPWGWLGLIPAVFDIFRPLPINSNKKLGKTALVIALICGLAINVLYMTWFVSKPQSGLRTFCQDALAGKYDDSIVVITPDGVAVTVGYYLPEKVRLEHHMAVHGYPRWENPFIPVAISDLAGQWVEQSVPDTERRIDELAAPPAAQEKGYKYIVVAKDSDKQIEFLSTKTVPRSTRIKKLMDYIYSKYKKVDEKSYPGLTEDVQVLKFEIGR